ncbi:hypothetical protein JCM10213_000646 [Rhodosporidiobolus nylandii]
MAPMDTSIYLLPLNIDPSTSAFWRDVGVRANGFFADIERARVLSGRQELIFLGERTTGERCDGCERLTLQNQTSPSPFLVDCAYSERGYSQLQTNASILASFEPAPPPPSFAWDLPSANPSPELENLLSSHSDENATQVAQALLRFGKETEIVDRSAAPDQDVERAVRASIPMVFRPSPDELSKGPFADELRLWDWRKAENKFWEEVLRKIVEVERIDGGENTDKRMKVQTAFEKIAGGERLRIPDLAGDKDNFNRTTFDRGTMTSYNNMIPSPDLQSFDGKANLFGPNFRTLVPGVTGPYLYVSGRNGTTKWHVDCSSAMNFITYAFEGKGKAIWGFIKWEDWPAAMKALDRNDETLRYSFELKMTAEDIAKIIEAGIEVLYCVQEYGDGVLIPAGYVHTVISLEASIKVAADYLLPCELERVKAQEKVRELYYRPYQTKDDAGKPTTPPDKLGAIDLAQVDEHAVLGVAKLGKLLGGTKWKPQAEAEVGATEQ